MSIRYKKTMNIKPAKFADMKTIASFIRSSADWYRPFLTEKDLKEHYVDEDWERKNYEMRDFYIGKTESDDVGTISIQYANNYSYLGYVYLDSKHVGQGYGHQLLDFAKEKSLEKEMEGMFLIAHPEAEWAIKAYEKYGFERKFTQRQDILSWNKGFLKPFYEEGFHLYIYPLAA